MPRKRYIFIALATGIILTLLTIFMSGRLVLTGGAGICPGIPYKVDANFTAGFPFSTTNSTTAMGTCGELFSHPQVNDYVQSMKSEAFISNLIFWTLITGSLTTLFGIFIKNYHKKPK